MASNLEMLYSLLNGEEAQAKKLEPTIVEDSPLVESPKIISDPEGAIKSKPARFVMQNYEPRAQEMLEEVGRAEKERSISHKGLQESKQILKEQISQPSQIKPYESKYSKDISDALAEIKAGGKQGISDVNEKDKMLTSMIQAFGGGVLGALAGGETGWKAGSAAGQVGIDLMRKSQERAAELEKLKVQKGEKVHTEKLKALLDMEKAEAERYKMQVEQEEKRLKNRMDMAEKLAGINSDEFKIAATEYKGFVDGFNKVATEGVKEAADAQLKSEGMESAERRAQMMAQAQSARLNMPTQAERQAASLYARSKANNDAYEKLEKKYNGKMPSTEGRTISMLNAMFETGPVTSATILGSNLMNEQEKEEMAGRIGFIAGVLRGDTGAAVTAPEFKRYDQQYFGQFGDTPDVLKRKAVDRKQALEGMRLEAGRAEIPPIHKIPTSADKPAEQKKPQKSIVSKQFSQSRNKTRVTYSDGSVEILDGQK